MDERGLDRRRDERLVLSRVGRAGDELEVDIGRGWAVDIDGDGAVDLDDLLREADAEPLREGDGGLFGEQRGDRRGASGEERQKERETASAKACPRCS